MKQIAQVDPVASKPLRLIRLAEVKRRTGLSTSTIYRWMKVGKFPRSRRVGEFIAAWNEVEIDDWIHAALERHHSNSPNELRE